MIVIKGKFKKSPALNNNVIHPVKIFLEFIWLK